MFFTAAGKIIAWLAVFLGASGVAMWAIIVNSSDPRATAQQYLGSNASGVDLSQFLLVIVAGIVLGILAEISETVAAAQGPKD